MNFYIHCNDNLHLILHVNIISQNFAEAAVRTHDYSAYLTLITNVNLLTFVSLSFTNSDRFARNVFDTKEGIKWRNSYLLFLYRIGKFSKLH